MNSEDKPSEEPIGCDRTLNTRNWEVFGEKMTAEDVEFIFGVSADRFVRRVESGMDTSVAIHPLKIRGEPPSKSSHKRNRIFQLRNSLGHDSITSVSRLTELPNDVISSYEHGRESPWDDKRGDWKASAKRLAEGLGQIPEEIWPEIANKKLPFVHDNLSYHCRVVDCGNEHSLDVHPKDVLRTINTIRGVLKLLTTRQWYCLLACFGFFGEPMTYAEAGRSLNKCPPIKSEATQGEGGSAERVRQHLVYSLQFIRNSSKKNRLLNLYASIPGGRIPNWGHRPELFISDFEKGLQEAWEDWHNSGRQRAEEATKKHQEKLEAEKLRKDKRNRALQEKRERREQEAKRRHEEMAVNRKKLAEHVRDIKLIHRAVAKLAKQRRSSLESLIKRNDYEKSSAIMREAYSSFPQFALEPGDIVLVLAGNHKGRKAVVQESNDKEVTVVIWKCVKCSNHATMFWSKARLYIPTCGKHAKSNSWKKISASQFFHFKINPLPGWKIEGNRTYVCPWVGDE